MKKLLVFLLISTIACAINEESHELDDVSLYGFNPFKDIEERLKNKTKTIKNQVEDEAKKLKDEANKQAEEVKSILKKLDGKNPFEKIKGHLKELEKSMKKIINFKFILYIFY